MQVDFTTRRLIAATLAASWICVACVTLPEKRQIEQDIGSLQAQLEVLRKRLETRVSETEESSSSSQQTLADLKASFDELKGEVAKINSQLEASRHYMESEKQANRKIFDDYELRFRDLEGKLAQNRAAVAESRSSAPAAAAVEKPVEKPKGEREEYEDITENLKDKPIAKWNTEELNETESKLLGFMRKYPQTKYKPAGHYWLGEIYQAKKDYKQAILQYDETVKADPKHQKAPAARLKQGICFMALGKTNEAKQFFQEVIASYPKSKEAQIAKGKLEGKAG